MVIKVSTLIPKRLCKIKVIDERNINNLLNKEIWVPKASKLNDPYDCAILPKFNENSVMREEDLDSYLSILSGFANLFSGFQSDAYCKAKGVEEKNRIAYEFVCSQLMNIGVVSFLDSPSNIVAWSHYGNNHTGMCLEFERVNSELDQFVSHVNGYQLENVSYMNIAPWFRWDELLKAPELGLRLCLTSKYKDWSYENESRLITLHHAGGHALSYEELGISLKKIYLGCRQEKDERAQKNRTKLLELCKKQDIEVIELVEQRSVYRLTEQPLLCNE